MKTGQLSVYMPVRNAAAFVRQAVDSIRHQAFSDFDFIIVDDGSTDQTPAILDQLAREDRRIKLFKHPHRGVAAAANFAINESDSEFIARMDGDDIAVPHRLMQQRDYLRGHPDCVAVGSQMLLIDHAGLPLYVMPQTVFGHQRIDDVLMHGGWGIAQPSSMYRREPIVAAGGYRPELSLHEDHDLFLRLAERGTLANLPDVLHQYRKHPGSLTSVESGTSTGVMRSILQQAWRRRGMADLPDGLVKEAKRQQPLDRCREWAWKSLKAGYVKTARKYAGQSLRISPFSFESWKLLYCTLRGR